MGATQAQSMSKMVYYRCQVHQIYHAGSTKLWQQNQPNYGPLPHLLEVVVVAAWLEVLMQLGLHSHTLHSNRLPLMPSV